MIKKVLNFRKISELLTGNPLTIRSNYIPKPYRADIKELELLISKWFKKKYE